MNFDKQLQTTMRTIRGLRGEVEGDLADALDSMLQMIAVIRTKQHYEFQHAGWKPVDSYEPPRYYYEIEYVMLLGPYADYEAEPQYGAFKEQVGYYSKSSGAWLSTWGLVLDPQPLYWRNLK